MYNFPNFGPHLEFWQRTKMLHFRMAEFSICYIIPSPSHSLRQIDTILVDFRASHVSCENMCPFSYWRAREANSESTGVVDFIKVRRPKKKLSIEARALARLTLKNIYRDQLYALFVYLSHVPCKLHWLIYLISSLRRY